MSLKQRLLKSVAVGITLTALSGVPAYSFYDKPNSVFDDSTILYQDIDKDGLIDMILGDKSGVTYLKGIKGGAFVNRQRICTFNQERKPMIALLPVGKELELIVIATSMFKIYSFNGREFVEHRPELQWMEDEEESKPAPYGSM